MGVGTRAVPAAAFLWGVAEATLFFIVPDVLVSAVATLRGTRPALLAALWAGLGGVAGGLAVFLLAAAMPGATLAAIDAVPGIGPAMLARAEDGLAAQGPAALFVGAFSGVPYKVYAATAPQAGLPLWVFALVSVPARLARFVLMALGVGLLARILRPRLGVAGSVALLAVCWVAFYAFYFAVTGA